MWAVILSAVNEISLEKVLQRVRFHEISDSIHFEITSPLHVLCLETPTSPLSPRTITPYNDNCVLYIHLVSPIHYPLKRQSLFRCLLTSICQVNKKYTLIGTTLKKTPTLLHKTARKRYADGIFWTRCNGCFPVSLLIIQQYVKAKLGEKTDYFNCRF